CTGFAGRAAMRGLIESARRDGVWNDDAWDLSPLALYAEERRRDGTLPLDDGATLARLVDVLTSRGLPRQDRWPYDPRHFTQTPPDDVWTAHQLVNVTPLTHDLEALRAALADGCVLVAGIPCYEGPGGIANEQTFSSGAIQMPAPDEARVGWH